MRLIDADTLVKDLSYLYTKNHIPVDMRAKEILTTIMEQPTAYSVDKVVDELEKEKIKKAWDYEDRMYNCAICDAIEIVKKGGLSYSDGVYEPSEDKIKVTSLEIIVTGKREKPYYEIKYKEVGKQDYKIGYSSYDLNNVFAWRDEFFEIVNHK